MVYQLLWVKAEAKFVEGQQWYYLTQSKGDKWVHTFPKSISLKGSIIARLEFELIYYNVAVQHIINYTMRTPPTCICIIALKYMRRQGQKNS